MENVKLGTVIAERVLKSSRLDSNVTIRIGCPQATAEGDFITPYQIIGAGDQEVRFAAGLDALQSLQLAIRMIGADISYGLKEYELKWADGDDAGLPMP